MPYAITPDKVRLHYDETGQGAPVLFVHEFAGDHRSWEPQMRELGKRYRCIAYAARGYTPSDVPADKAAYTYQHVMRDCVAVLDHLKIEQAHIVGLSMGGYTTLQVALNHPGRVRSMVLAGTGSGSERAYTEQFHKNSQELALVFEREGSVAVAKTYGNGPSRVPLRSRMRAALRNFPGCWRSTTRKAPPIPRAASRAGGRRSTTSRAAFER